MGWRPPADVRAAAAGERVLAWARCADGPAVATRGALLLPGQDRLPWESVEHAAWSAPTLTVTAVDGTVRTADCSDPGALPEVVRERVTASVIGETHVELRRGRGVRLVARRTEPGGVRWSTTFDPGLDPSDPELAAAAQAALAATRSAWGV